MTETSSESYGFSGPDRVILYRLAMGTGFRRGELRSLTPESFDLSGNPPTVTVEAAYSKRRRTDVQPIRPELAELLRTWLRGKRTRRPVFDMTDTDWHRTARMLKADLTAARVVWLDEAESLRQRKQREQTSTLMYIDDAGLVADFHALRHTYITNIGRGVTSMKTHQELARHSEPGLTMRYTHPQIHDKTAALGALPSLVPEPAQHPEAHTTARHRPGRPTYVIACQDTDVGGAQGTPPLTH